MGRCNCRQRGDVIVVTQAFADRRVNLVNAHREFFYVTALEVKAVLRSLQGDLLTFVDAPEALEWHQSENARRGSGEGASG